MRRPATTASASIARRADSLMQALEPRHLLAAAFTFTDVDGDEVTVKLTGDGNAQATLSGGATGSIDFLTLSGTTASSALSISVKQQGGDGRVDMDGMTSGVDLAKFIAPTTDLTNGAEVNVNSLTSLSLGDLLPGATVNVDAAAGKAMALVFRNIGDADVLLGGVVKTFKANFTADEANVEASDTVASVAVAGDMGGEWDAANFGKITVGSTFRALMNASLPDAKGYSFGAIKAGSASGAGLSHPFQTNAGRIKSITIASSWIGGGILAAGIDTLKVNTDFLPTSVNLSEDTNVLFSIKTGTVGGTLNGLFILGGPVGALKLGATGGGLEFDAVGDRVNVKSITFTTPSNIVGDFEFNSIGALSAATSRLGGSWELNGANAKGQSIGAIKALNIDEFLMDAGLSGGVGSITAGEIDASEFIATFFTKVAVKAKGGADGSIDEIDIIATGADTAGFSFKSVAVGGGIFDSWIVAAQNVDKFSTFSFIDSDLFVGLTSPLQDDHPDFDSFADFNGTGLLNRFTITGKFDLVNPVFDESHVVSATIANIAIAGLVETDQNDDDFGFGARTFGKVALKDPVLGKAIKPVIAANPGDTNPFLPLDSDFIFRVYA